MTEPRPKVVVLAGPNGAGKSTSAERLLRGVLEVDEFVNADTIAQGLSAFAQQRVAFQAGRIMLRRLHELAAAKVDFAFETTLASRSYAPWLRELKTRGYDFHLVFLWLPTADLAVARIADRVRMGGHNVPESIVRRRYGAGLSNLRSLYLPLADSWQVFDNRASGQMRLIAIGGDGAADKIYLPDVWKSIASLGPTA